MTKLQAPEGHRHPTLYVGGEEDKGAVLYDHFEIGIQEFQDKIEVRLRREHIEKLKQMSQYTKPTGR